MPLTDQELLENHVGAILKYARDNGGFTDEERGRLNFYSFEVKDNALTLTSWTHSSTQPTIAQLKACTVAEANAEICARSCVISPLMAPSLTTAVRDLISVSDGWIIYNTTTNKLQVRANNAWVDLH